MIGSENVEDLILALDFGTTHWKAALFTCSGQMTAIERIRSPEVVISGYPCYRAEDLPEHLADLIDGLGRDRLKNVKAIAITGMAESGGLVRKADQCPITEIRPWFDHRSVPVFDKWRHESVFRNRQYVTGLPDSYKYSVYKLLAFQEEGLSLDGCWLLGVAEQACMVLTGTPATDETLAARSGAFNIFRRIWDIQFINALDLPMDVFPLVLSPGMAANKTSGNAFGLPAGIPVCICGHDHVCAAYGADALAEGQVLLSMGTAQVMITGQKSVSPEAISTGLSYGPLPNGQGYTCLGSIQSAGGSLNYWKKLLFPGEDYAALMAAAEQADLPTDLTWLPYLNGSGAPHIQPEARAALSGLSENTGRSDVIAAVYEGIAMESRFVLERMGRPRPLTCLGGLTRHDRLISILASVANSDVILPIHDEGTLYGAARMAVHHALAWNDFPALNPGRIVYPDPVLVMKYEQKYRQDYLSMMQAVLEGVSEE